MKWLMFSLGIAFSCNHHLYILCLQAVFFIIIVLICAVAIKYASFRKIKEHILHSVEIMKATWKNGKLYRITIDGSNNLDCDAIKVFSQRGFETSELIPFDNPGTSYSCIYTYQNRETINNIFRRKNNSINHFGNIEKQIDKKLINSMYTSVEQTFTKHSWH